MALYSNYCYVLEWHVRTNISIYAYSWVEIVYGCSTYAEQNASIYNMVVYVCVCACAYVYSMHGRAKTIGFRKNVCAASSYPVVSTYVLQYLRFSRSDGPDLQPTSTYTQRQIWGGCHMSFWLQPFEKDKVCPIWTRNASQWLQRLLDAIVQRNLKHLQSSTTTTKRKQVCGLFTGTWWKYLQTKLQAANAEKNMEWHASAHRGSPQ